MNSYLRELSEKSKKVRRQVKFYYSNHNPLPKQNPYGRNFFTIPQTINAEHMYPNIIVVKVTPACLGDCAFCFRQKQRTEELNEITPEDMKIINQYVQNYNSGQEHDLMKIKEILITGGEPFLLNIRVLRKLLESVKNVGIEFIRIGSRATTISPWLIQNELINMLNDYKPLTIIAHYNHVDELTKESLEASEKILSAGITIKNQSVLLRGVNDRVEELCNLHWKLSRNSILPYRLNHCTPVGFEQLRTTVREGIALVKEVQSMSGAIGHFHFNVITPLGIAPGFTESHILDEKKGAELIEMYKRNPEPFFDLEKINPDAQYLKIHITSRTIKDPNIPKEAWYRDGIPTSIG